MIVKRLLRSVKHNIFSRKYKHMTYINPNFGLSKRLEDGGRSILWDDKEVYKLKSLASIKNQHSGPCFLLATGPSVNEHDLSKISQFPIIAVNGSVKILKKYNIKPEYYMINDVSFFRDRFDYVKEVIALDSKCFFSSPGLSEICNNDLDLLKESEIYLMEKINHQFDKARLSRINFSRLINSEKDFFINPNLKYTKKQNIGFSENIEKGFFEGRTVVYFALQAAYYLGFDEVYILGMDLGPNTAGAIRAYDEKGDSCPSGLVSHFDDHIKHAFETLKEFSKTRNFSVYNLSQNSLLSSTIVPKISFEEALDKITE